MLNIKAAISHGCHCKTVLPRQDDSSSFCRFCFPCISQWAKLATICPFDRQSFRSVKRKRLDPAALQGSDHVELGQLPGKVLETLHYEERQQVRL